MMYQSRPVIKSKKVVVLSLVLLILAVILFSISPKAGLNITPVLQLAAILCATASLFMLIKYVIYDYLYTVDNGKLTVHKINKSKSVCVCDVEMRHALCSPMSIEEYKLYLKNNPASKVYSFIKNPRNADLKYIPFEVNGERFTILIEPDKDFLISLSHEKYNNDQTEEGNDE